MQKHTFNYVRTFRQRHALSSEELAHLINQRSPTAVSFIESGERLPTLEGALALQVLFGQAPRELFPGFFEHVEEAVMRRVLRLLRRLEGKTDPRSTAKRDLLEAIPGRKDANDTRS